ncbi:hypothetical protein [Mucilaginibacter boryungensis]|uniref:Lipocalin-like protein n=1 Tax=Mucilaginibacter boryungensis TaxID=768480 RepID=A0ABR9XH11_9SPHI|nr:hypothetical protein [Mucilaginibacter boryungensis]MBE9666500.1 hypothetical protein [Mucilaginibacter boryungensis]
MKNILYLLIAVALLTSCIKNSDADATPQINDTYDIDNVYGQWLLTTINDKAAGTSISPTDENLVVFSTAGTVKYYTNSALTSQDTFTIIQGKSIYTIERTYQLSYGSTTLKRSVLIAKKDTLLLADEVANGKSYLYTHHK